MVALNEQLQHCEVPASEWTLSPDVIEGCDFTKSSGEVHGGFVVICGVAGFCGLSDASPLRPRSAAPLNQSDPEGPGCHVRNRTYNPAICTVLRQEPKSPGRPGRASNKIAVLWEIQRDPIGYQGGPNLYQYAASNALRGTDPQGLWRIPFVFDSFINGQLRGQWLPQPSIGPIESGWQFEANTRGFGQFSPGNSKLFSEGWIESKDIGKATTTADAYWGASDVGDSVRRRWSAGFQRWIYQSAKAVVYGGQPKVTDGFTGGTVRCDTAIRFSASAAYPFIPGSPAIAYDIIFDFAVVAHNKVTVIISGFTTQFPDFEAYADGSLIYRHESPFSGPSFNNLGPGNEIDFVNVTKTFSAPTACKCSKSSG